MELTTEPEIYVPSIDSIGNYIDKIPSFTRIKYGIRCPCGTRKDKIYDTSTAIHAHIKTNTHQKWLNQLNLNKANYYIENEQLKETLHNQKRIIAKFEKELQNKIMTIDYLTQQLCKKPNEIINDLLNFDE
jgi:hypothetical protein